jgi:hypothetical protein
VNLLHHPEHAQHIADMKATLLRAGAEAPPWFQAPEVLHNHTLTPTLICCKAPEVAHLSKSQLGQELCNAAHRAGSVQPMDF